MPRAVQDHVLLSYEVHMAEGIIILHTVNPGEPPARTQVRFTGVEAYRFDHDAHLNLLYGVEAVPVERLIKDHLEEGGSVLTAAHHGLLAGHPRARQLALAA